MHCCCTPLIQSWLELASISSSCNNIKLTCNKVCVFTFWFSIYYNIIFTNIDYFMIQMFTCSFYFFFRNYVKKLYRPKYCYLLFCFLGSQKSTVKVKDVFSYLLVISQTNYLRKTCRHIMFFLFFLLILYYYIAIAYRAVVSALWIIIMDYK